MRVLDCIDVNDAFRQGLNLIVEEGVRQPTRNGDALALQEGLVVVYQRPLQRVLFDPKRDANPFFHLFESLWLLAGRNDARWLDRFVSDFSERFAEEDGNLHGSYGFRWRRHFDLEGEGNPNMPDQLDTIVRLLKQSLGDRRAVIQMWDPVSDLGQAKKDVPCNLIAIPRIRTVLGEPFGTAETFLDRSVLDLTVFNRSNDFVWGLAGANAVQFSFLLEYLAGRIGVEVGTYTQISTNAHVYSNILSKLGYAAPMPKPYPEVVPIGTDWEHWDKDLTRFMQWADNGVMLPLGAHPPISYCNPWFKNTVEPFYLAHNRWRCGNRQGAYEYLVDCELISPDWKEAGLQWFERRLKKQYLPKEAAV